MYRGRGAGRWAELSSGARGLPYKPPACACTATRRDEPEGTRSLPCLVSFEVFKRSPQPLKAGIVATAVFRPCCRRCGSVDWGGEGAEGASATGSEELPPALSAAA